MIDVRYCVQGTITTSDTALVDQIETALPSKDSPRVGGEYTVSRDTNDDGTETLRARTSFADSAQGQARAEYLYEQITNSDLAQRADNWAVLLYRTPEGGVRPDGVREWHRIHPDQQPLTDDGASYIPTAWDPAQHTIKEESN